MQYPQNLLSDLCWTFVGTKFEDQEVFNQAVQKYQLEICPDEEIELRWKPDERLLPDIKRVELLYEGVDWEVNALDEKTLTLTSDDEKGFTALELLFKIHNAVVEELNDIDHHFFEGITLSAVEGDQAVLEMYCGS